MFLRSVRITNVRAIGDIRLDFENAEGGVRPRTVFLGENGCGKSTALRAIALVLAGSDALTQLLRDPKHWIRQGRKRAAVEATIETKTGDTREIALELRPEWNLRMTLRSNEATLQLLDNALRHSARNYFVLGYGVTRRPALAGQEFVTVSDGGFAHPRSRGLATMFSPEARLVSFEQWAMDVHYRQGEEGLAIVRQAVNRLLPGMRLKDIDRRHKTVLFQTQDGTLPFSLLSDGYQNVANWVGDVLYNISNTFEDHRSPLRTRGLLLVDELDLHLHPVWQRKLLDFLSRALPNMQLVGTSHSPMIAQQLREGELYVVERPSRRRAAELRAVVGDPSRLTLSQLMSPMFGIDSTESERVAGLREKARRKPASLTASERSELTSLTREADLPEPFLRQLRAVEQLADAVQQRAGGVLPRLDPEALRVRGGSLAVREGAETRKSS